MQLTLFQPLIWLLAIVVLAVGFAVSLVDRPAGLRWASFLCRVIAVMLLVLALCRPVIFDEGRDLHVLFLVDVSESVDLDEAIAACEDVTTATEALSSGDSHALFAVANGVRPFDEPAQLATVLKGWQEGIADDAFRSASRLAEALLATRLEFPSGKARRVVLFSDGQETHEEVKDAIAILAEEQIDVVWRPLEGIRHSEAAIVSMESSAPHAFEGEVVRMKVTMAANESLSGQLRILHKGVAVRQMDIHLEPGRDNVAEIDVPMTTPGDSLWTAELLPEDDHFPLNNQGKVTVRVTGKPRVLVLHEKPREMRNFARAMKEQEIEVDTRGIRGLPESMEGLLAFDAIMLADISATDLTPRQMELLKRYVIDFGGGVAMLGSENSFGLGGYYKTPVEEVLPLISRFEKEKEKPSLAMMLVIDKSGSMQGVPIALARQAAKATVELLGARDQIGVIGFDSQPQIVSELRSASEADAIQASIDSLDASGGTDLYPAMVTGKEMLDNAVAKIKHMIILTDGQTGDADFQGLTQAMTESAITVSAVALGEGAARELLAGIAEIGKGRYYETMDPSTVPQIFTKETMQASKSAIKEDLYATIVVADHPMLAGYTEDDLPFTLGYVMTEPKPTSQVVLGAETGDPLLAVGRYGLGHGLAYTSDLTDLWGGEWLAWEECGKFWAQALRVIVRKADAEGMQVMSEIDHQNWQLTIKRLDPNRVPVSKITWDAQALDEYGKAISVTVNEVGLGRYEAVVPIGNREKLTLRLRDEDNDLLKVLHYHQAYPREYALATDVPESVEKLTPFQATSLRDGLQPIRTRRSVSTGFYIAALAFLFAGILLRRV